MRWITVPVVAVLILGVSCRERDTVSKAPAASGAKPAAAPPTEVAGFCSEHHVLEAVCTKCNPKLIPVFQAKGDWCAEHGVPESQCLKCDPKLKIVRPSKPAGGN